MRCQNCGTFVDDALDVCPACHASLRPKAIPIREDQTWCASCGSHIPSGSKTCPECGMPVKGAFEEDDEVPSLLAVRQSTEDAAPLLSAIPPAPSGGEDEQLVAGRGMRNRLTLVAALAALLLVTGTTLFITRPWDPNAYVTHSFQDADTSMEGFPGEVSHLSSQDFVKDAEFKASEQQFSELLDRFDEELGAIAQSADALEDRLESFVVAGKADDMSGTGKEAYDLRERLSSAKATVSELDLTGTQLAERRDSLLVLASYLAGETEALVKACTAAEQANGSADDASAVRVALGTKVDGHTLKEWHDLFRNAYHS